MERIAVGYVDRRFGFEERWYSHAPRAWAVRLPDDLLFCTCFLLRGPDALPNQYLGTGFFVVLRSGDSEHVYLVTAKHVLFDVTDKRALESGTPRPVWARWPRIGPYPDVPVQLTGQWHFSDIGDDGISTDAAVMLLDKQRRPAGTISEKAFASRDVFGEYMIGIGDELSVVGLFWPLPGKKGPVPIVRTGTIAAMRGEHEITVEETGQRIRPHLAELRSWGGLSGSPVFVNLGYDRDANGHINPHGPVKLFGLISGHLKQRPDAVPTGVYSPDELHMGIALVTSWPDVQAILERDDVVRERQQAEEPSQFSVVMDTLDSASDTEPAFTKAAFEEALRKASRRVPPEKKS